MTVLFLGPGWVGVVNAQDEREAQEDEVVFEEATRNCISSRRIRRIRIVDDQNILIYFSAQKIYHNRLRNVCRGLKRQGTFSYNSNDGLMCDGDGIAGFSGVTWGDVRPVPRCWLGVHREISKEDADAMREAAKRKTEIEPMPLPMPNPSEVVGEVEQPES